MAPESSSVVNLRSSAPGRRASLNPGNAFSESSEILGSGSVDDRDDEWNTPPPRANPLSLLRSAYTSASSKSNVRQYATVHAQAYPDTMRPGSRRSSKRSDSPLDQLEDLEEQYVDQLRRLVWFYDNELLMDGVALASRPGAETVVLNTRELVQFHEGLLVSIRLARKAQLEEDEPVVAELLEILDEGTPLYMTYAAGVVGAKEKISGLRQFHSLLDSAANEFDFDWLIEAPLEQPKKYLLLLREMGCPSRRLANLLQLEDYMTLLQEKDFVLGAVGRVTESMTFIFANDRYDRACHHLRNALFGWADPVRTTSPNSLSIYRLYCYMYPLQVLCLLLLALLSLFEQPTWCYGNPAACVLPPWDAPEGSILYNANVSFFPVFLGLGLEILAQCLLFFISTMPKLLSFTSFYWAPLISSMAIGAAVVDDIVSLVMAYFGIYRRFRLSVWMRPVLFIITFRSGRSAMKDVVVAVGLSIPFLLALLVFLFMFGIIGTVFWGASFPHWDNFWTSLTFLQTCLVTANFPDVMLPEYYENRWTFLYFFVFMVIGNFFLLSLLLGQIIYSYRYAVDTGVRRFSRVRRRELMLTFHALAGWKRKETLF